MEKDPQLRVLILTGTGDKAFVAGAEIHELDKRDMLHGRTETRRRQDVYTRIEQLEIPSFAAINGWALGTGLELTMACTIRVASSQARLGQPQVRLGITPGEGGTQRLPRPIGMGRAKVMILTGDPVNGNQSIGKKTGNDKGFATFFIRLPAEIGQQNRPGKRKSPEYHTDIQPAGPQIVGVDRQKGHHDTHTGDRGKDREK